MGVLRSGLGLEVGVTRTNAPQTRNLHGGRVSPPFWIKPVDVQHRQFRGITAKIRQ
jgi:hypothetical protein